MEKRQFSRTPVAIPVAIHHGTCVVWECLENISPGGAYIRGTRIANRGDRIAPWGEEPVLCVGREAALMTSGGYGHRIGSAIALASLPRGVLECHAVEVELLGRRYRAQPSVAPPFDPTGACALG